MTSEVTLICHLLNARVLIWKTSYREKTDGKNWDLFPNKEEKSQRVKHCTLILLPSMDPPDTDPASWRH